jgi:signal transduction histidine kinase/ActR/RegA family two-component response regulator
MESAQPAMPFGIELSLAVFDRATLVARGLFPGSDSLVILVKDGVAWRSRPSRHAMPVRDRAAEIVIATGETLWLEDGDERFAKDPLVTGPPYLRTWIGAPIKLADGTTPGVLVVASTQPIAKDPAKVAQLQALADFVADEWARAQISAEHERSRRTLDYYDSTHAALLGLVPMSLVILDAEMRVVAASKVWERHLHVEGKDYVGRSLYEISAQVYEPFRKSFEHVLKGNSVSGRRVRVGRHNDVGHIWMQTEMAPWRTPTGEIGGLLILADDVTEIVETLESAERTEQRLNLALELSGMHVWELDYANRKLFTAGAEDSFFERPQTYADLYKDIFVTIDPRDIDHVRVAWKAHVEEGAPYRPQYRIARSDGREVWAEGVVSYHADAEGRPQRLVGVLQNITERKKAEDALIAAKEEAESATKAKSAFLATMSHEIRTPLNGVLGMAQAMEADELSPTQRERLTVVRQSGETLLAILNDVLDLSKIEAGKLELDETEFDIQDLARGAHAAFTAVAGKKGIAFGLTIDRAAGGVYRGDATRVRQVLYNLVSNAIKFTERGEVQVRVTRRGGQLVLSVRDSGIGIAPEALKRLFAKFEQADATTTRRYGGTGLGLAICRELSELMGGSIEAESHPGEGSAFTVRLPLARIGASRPAAQTPTTSVVEPEGLPLKVLAAEDNDVNRLVLQTLLQQVGLSPTIVADGAQALEAWEREPWDLILMDVQMPVMDGPTACARIRQREAETGRQRTAIVALTANAMAHQVAEYRAAGMDGFVAKPIQVAALFAAMTEALASGAGGPPLNLSRAG